MVQENTPKCNSECLEFLYYTKLLENYEKELESLESAENVCVTNISLWGDTCGDLQQEAKTSVMEVSRKEVEAYKTMLNLVDKRINEINKEFGK